MYNFVRGIIKLQKSKNFEKNLKYSFRPHRNPVTFSLISVTLVLYCCLLVVCRRADSHDAMKGGIVYLLDNTPIDQQKYEITIETGFRKGAGTSAKVIFETCPWVKVFRINPEFRILRLTFQRKSASKCRIRLILIASLISFRMI